ncbi:MAG: DUF4349 domain-containing protein [Gaiellaceae bacterium]
MTDFSDRHVEALVAELRASTPPAPERLRRRIEELAATEPVARVPWLQRLSLRRFVLIAAPAVVAIGLGAAVVHGIASSGDPTRDVAAFGIDRADRERPGGTITPNGSVVKDVDQAWTGSRAPGAHTELRTLAPSSAKGLPPAPGRRQDYRATMRLRVDGLDELSSAAKSAIRLTRAWGGYVVSAQYDVPGREGEARLEVRIPVEHVQAAVQRFSELGTLVAQDVSIRDVQGRLDRYTREILALRERIARLRTDLTDPALTPAERARLELRLARSQRAVAERRADRAALARRASFAKVELVLTTREAAAATTRDKDGRIERAVDDAASVLARELAFLLYALIVSAPFLVLAAGTLFAARAGRRRADTRLLERA